MKKFNLRKELVGRKVKLRNGVMASVINFDESDTNYPIYCEHECGRKTIHAINGKYYQDEVEHAFDIVEIEEHKISLPKPVRKLEGNRVYYRICVEFDDYCDYMFTVDIETIDINLLNKGSCNELLENGQLFETEQDAQAWLDFMKSYGIEE